MHIIDHEAVARIAALAAGLSGEDLRMLLEYAEELKSRREENA